MKRIVFIMAVLVLSASMGVYAQDGANYPIQLEKMDWELSLMKAPTPVGEQEWGRLDSVYDINQDHVGLALQLTNGETMLIGYTSQKEAWFNSLLSEKCQVSILFDRQKYGPRYLGDNIFGPKYDEVKTVKFPSPGNKKCQKLKSDIRNGTS